MKRTLPWLVTAAIIDRLGGAPGLHDRRLTGGA